MMPMVDGVPGSVTKSGNVVNPVFSQDHKNLDAVQKPRAAIKRASAFFQVLLQL